MTDGASFALGESEADQPGPSISQQENIGATYKIVTSMPQGRGVHTPLYSPAMGPAPLPEAPPNQTVWRDYTLPVVPHQSETVTPAIEMTPLGTAMKPGPDAIPPAIPSGAVGVALHQPAEDGGFQSGVIDGYPEGVPVPLR